MKLSFMMKTFAIENLIKIMADTILIESTSPINAIRKYTNIRNINKVSSLKGSADYSVREVIFRNGKTLYKSGSRSKYYAK